MGGHPKTTAAAAAAAATGDCVAAAAAAGKAAEKKMKKVKVRLSQKRIDEILSIPEERKPFPVPS
ncbi:hypothetical protein ACP4OV_006279 [Aristida adscensionis]